MNKKTLIISMLLFTSLVLAGCTININDARNDDKVRSSDTMHSMNGMGCMNHRNEDTTDNNCMHDSSDANMMMHSVNNEEEFIVNMIPHHQEAVDTARMVLEKSTHEELKVLAENIIDAQTKEIAMMQGWMRSWYPNSTVKANYENMMPALETLSGSSLDKAFLQGMIMHHMGAIHMAENVLKVHHKPETAKLAENIISSQNNEIRIMQDMIKELQ